MRHAALAALGAASLAPLGALAQATVPEGGEVDLDAPISATSWAWDIDGDAEIDDCVDWPTCTFVAEGLDGPDDARIDMLVDGASQFVDVTIENVPPSFVSTPPTTVRRGAEYRYVPAVTDPAGDQDPYTLVVDESPEGMVLSSDVPPLLSWTPTDLDLSSTLNPHHVRLFAEDDDGGVSEQEWDITVLDNAEPASPSLLWPTTASGCVVEAQPSLRVANSPDPDGDAVTYFFELDSSPTFNSIDLQPSGPVPEGLSGETEWQVPRALANGTQFFWRAWSSDGIEESLPIVEVFETCFIDLDGGSPDLPPPRRERRHPEGGCSCLPQPAEGTGDAEEAGLGLLGLALVFVLRPRR